MEQQDQTPIKRSLDLRNYGHAAFEAVNSRTPDDNMNLDTTPAAQSAESRVHDFQSQPSLVPFSHPPLVFRQHTRVSDQQLQTATPIRDSSRNQSEYGTNQINLRRGRPASSRSRSRSPTAATHPLLYRDRSQEVTVPRHDGDAGDYTAEGGSACDSAGLDRQLRLDKLRKEKNDYAVCVTCWLKDLPCNHQWPCSECKAGGKVCAYVACISGGGCPLDTKCPCFHGHRSLPQETPTRMLGSSMHLIALLNLKRSFLESDDTNTIQAKVQHPTSATQLHLRLQPEIQHLLDQGQRFRDSVVRTLLRESDKVPYMNYKVLKTKARFNVEVVKEKK
jgi:hypothetical protein